VELGKFVGTGGFCPPLLVYKHSTTSKNTSIQVSLSMQIFDINFGHTSI